MQILIGCAKDMNLSPRVHVPVLSEPAFLKEAEANARQMAGYTEEELQRMLGVSPKLAADVRRRYQTFGTTANPVHAAITAYDGVVFRNMDLAGFSDDDFRYAQSHLWITSFLYGLLRPLDGIRLYRLEGKVVLPENAQTMFAYWRGRLTDVFIESIRRDDGILADLASAEMRQLFDWKRVEREVTVVKPDFYVDKGGRLTMPSVAAKKCRGAMTSWIIRRRIDDVHELADFSSGNFFYRGDGNGADSFSNPVFINDNTFAG